jgi:hypothetical protein
MMAQTQKSKQKEPRASEMALPESERIEILKEFIKQEDGTEKYVWKLKASFSCCSYEIVRDQWAPEEITKKMIKGDMRSVRRWCRDHSNEHRAKDSMNICFSVIKLREDRLTPEQKQSRERLDDILNGLMLGSPLENQ